MMRGPFVRAEQVETYIKQAAEQLATLKKAFDRDIEILAHIRTADNVLVDSMQPTVAIEKANDEMRSAEALLPPFDVEQGVIASKRVLETARLSPTTTDFGKLRSVIRSEALGPASRAVTRNALRLNDEMNEWIKIQQMISDQLRMMSDISSTSLRAAEQ